MNRDGAPWRPVTAAAVGWSANETPCSLDFGDVYYSRDDGRAESEYVFVQGNDLPRRWRQWGEGHCCIAETGFGTGLNFLATWQAWRALPAGRPSLHYLSIEKHPLARDDLARALGAWRDLATPAGLLLKAYPGLLPGQHRLQFEGGRLILDLWWEDVSTTLASLAACGRPLVHAWYLDGFAPARNPAMWQPEVLQHVAALSRPGATFSTFTAAGEVRRQLGAAGFSVAKVPGYGRKRESLRGYLEREPTRPAEPVDTPWDVPVEFAARPRQALVLGAGLAGCTVAAALALRGIEVTVLEAGRLAAGGSGNEQGVLYTRLARRHSALADFNLESYRFSTVFYRDRFLEDALINGVDGALCGCFQAGDEAAATLGAALQTVPELAAALTPGEACDRLGILQPAAGSWFPGSGWLRPASVCRALVQHPAIRLIEQCGQVTLAARAGSWRATDAAGRHWDAPCAVIAAGTASARLAGLDWLPLQAIRGQTTHLPGVEPFSRLRAVLCHSGYIAPARLGMHCIGATFDSDDAETGLRPQDHRSNLERLARAVPGWQDALSRLDPGSLQGRVGYRCVTPDHLPAVGAVPDRHAFLRDYAGLGRNARRPILQRGDYLPGLFVSTAHGARGLTSTPLAAELLASAICGEPPPVDRHLVRALAPGRFIIRDLSRNKP